MKWAERLQKREPPVVAAPEIGPAPAASPLRESNPQAMASLVCGLLGFIFPIVASALGIMFGRSALRRVREQGAGGRRVAIAGITIATISFIASGALLVIVLTQMIHASSEGNRARCADNLRQIGQAILLYANENNGHFPPRFEPLLLTQDIPGEVFVCPASRDTPAPGGTPPDQANFLSDGDHLSYTYVGAALTTKTATHDTPIAYEQLSNHGDGMNVLFGDGHVSWINKQDADLVLNKSEIRNPKSEISTKHE